MQQNISPPIVYVLVKEQNIIIKGVSFIGLRSLHQGSIVLENKKRVKLIITSFKDCEINYPKKGLLTGPNGENVTVDYLKEKEEIKPVHDDSRVYGVSLMRG